MNEIIEENNNYGKNNIGKNKSILITYITKNNTSQYTEKEIKELIYIDNLSRVLINCGYDVTNEYLIVNNEINQTNEIKNKLNTYRIYFNNYIYSKELEETIKIESFLSEIKQNPRCIINNNELCLQNNKEEYISLLTNEGTYTINTILLAYLKEKMQEQFNSIYINNEYKNIQEYTNLLKINKINILEQQEENSIDTKNNINEIRFSVIKKYTEYNYNEIEKIYNEINKQIIINKNNLKETQSLEKSINNIEEELYKFKEIPKEILTDITKQHEIIGKYLNKIIKLYKDKNINEIKQYNLLLSYKIIIENILDLIGIIPIEI